MNALTEIPANGKYQRHQFKAIGLRVVYDKANAQLEILKLGPK